MDSPHSASANPKVRGPISQLLAPIRGRLIVAAMLAAIGSMLTLVPLAAIAHIGQTVLGNLEHEPGQLWWSVLVAVTSLCIGMLLITAGELLAHLADNRITHHLRLAIVRRLSRVPLGWFTQRAAGEVKQAIQDDINTLHSLTAHFYTTVGRAGGAVAISLIYLFALDWRLAMVSILPFPGFFIFLPGRSRPASTICRRSSRAWAVSTMP